MNFILPGILLFIFTYFVIKHFMDFLSNIGNNSYIGNEIFPTEHEFEILRVSKFRNFINYFFGVGTGFKIGKTQFDSDFLISSDNRSVAKAIASDEKVQQNIYLIFSQIQAHSIVVRDDYIKVKIKYRYLNKRKTEDFPFFSEIMAPLRMLKAPFLEALEKNSSADFSEDKEAAQEKSYFLNKIQILYVSFLVAIMGQFMYTSIAHKNTVLMMDSLGFIGVYFWALSFFAISIFCIWLRLLGSVRTHILYWKSLYLLFPACIFLSYHLLYSANLIFDSSPPETVQVAHSVHISGGRSRSYYYNIKKLPEENQSISNIRITYSKFLDLRDHEKSEITYQKGWLGSRYITNIKPI